MQNNGWYTRYIKRQTLLTKLLEWAKRYLPAEILAAIAAVAAAAIAYRLTHSPVVTALAASVGDNAGYYGYFVTKEMRRHYLSHADHPPLKRLLATGVKTFRDMLVEFGVAEIIDTFTRPLILYGSLLLIQPYGLAVVVGKIAADLLFYAFTVSGYELRKHWFDGTRK